MKTFITLLVALFVLTFTPNLHAQTYVNAAATGNNDGTSWADAYTELATALDNYSPGDEIWVAAGTYLPQQPSAWPGAPENTFYIYQDLKLYGGFDGTETMFSERDPAANVTTLSGDLNGDDVDDDFENNREDNAINVVFVDTVITSATFIDGFTIRSGHADGDPAVFHQTRGGGMMAWGSPQISQCLFTYNYAINGGGLYLRDETSAVASVTDCIFENNEAVDAGGGLIVVTLDSSKVVPISNCHFIGNHAVRLAGGLGVRASSVELTGCSFTQNSNEAAGGGIFFFVLDGDGSDYQFSLTECDFTENVSANGGGFYYETDATTGNDLTLTACNFTGNQSLEFSESDFPEGGGLQFLYYGAGPQNDTIRMIDCVLEDNTTEGYGGAIMMWDQVGTGNYFAVEGCDFSRNIAGSITGGLVHYSVADEGNGLVSDCTFTDNVSPVGGGLLYQTDGTNSNYTVKNCDFVSNESTGPNEGGGGAYIVFTSNIPTTSNHATVDSCYFENNSAGLNGGGLYLQDMSLRGSSHVLNSTFVSNSATYGAGLQVNAEGTDYEVQLSNCEFSENQASEFGGGFRVASTDPSLELNTENCLFENNIADVDGGGMEIVHYEEGDGEAIITNTEFLNNTSGNEGAGLNYYLGNTASGSLTVEGTLFSGNTNDATGNAVEGAGGFALNNFGNGIAEVNLQSSIFENNSSEDGAGAIQLYKVGTATADEVNIENCLLNNNSGGEFAGGIGMAGSIRLTVESTTIADNTNGGISIEAGLLDMQNTILHNVGSDDFSNSSINNVTSLGGNLVGDNTMETHLNSTDQSSADPLFEAGTYQLSQNSPAVDAGTLPDNPPATDLAGNDRVQGGCIDIGAYESPYDAGTSCLTDTWEVLADPSTIFIYPNPVVATASISIENEWNGELNLRIVNALGQVVFENDFEKFDRTAVLEFDASDLPEGMYRVLVSDGETMAVSSFVKN